MNISKKAILSFIMVLTSVVSMAQPYYHIMKEENGKLIEDTVFNGKDYNIKIDMVEPEKKPEGAIGGKITVEGYDCDDSYYKRSFYFTNKGNVYYNTVIGSFEFEKSQLDYPTDFFNKRHRGLFRWGRTLDECLSTKYDLYWSCYADFRREQEFYFAKPKTLKHLKNYLGKQEWALLSACEWRYVCEKLGECGWKVDGKICYLIDTTPGKSLLTELRRKNNGNTSNLSIEQFKSLEARGLVCLPASGWYWGTNNTSYGYSGNYWSCTPSRGSIEHAWCLYFGSNSAYTIGNYRSEGGAVRLVVLADD